MLMCQTGELCLVFAIIVGAIAFKFLQFVSTVDSGLPMDSSSEEVCIF